MASNTHEGQHQAAHQSTDILHVREPSTFTVPPVSINSLQTPFTLGFSVQRISHKSREKLNREKYSCCGRSQGWWARETCLPCSLETFPTTPTIP